MTLLLPQHLADLRRSGLSDETIRAAGIYSESDGREVARLLRWNGDARQLGPCLVLPYRQLDGTLNCHVRLRPDHPRPNAGKYEAPLGVGNRAYFPSAAIDAIKTKGARLGLTEGEKKALCSCQAGVPCIGLAGVWSWQKKREKDEKGKGQGERLLIDDLDQIDWAGREVPIIFDTDPRRNPSVAQAKGGVDSRAVGTRGTADRRCSADRPRRCQWHPDEDGAGRLRGRLRRRRLSSAGRVYNSQADVKRRSLEEYRAEILRNRVSSVGFPGLYLDASPTGSGKSYADMPAAQKAGSSLTIQPSHKNCEQTEEDYQRFGLSAVAYPQLCDETCQNFNEAERVLNVGLGPTDAICPSCPFFDGCEYHAILEEAEASRHRIATHKRAEFTFSHLADGRRYITIHEDSTSLLRPKMEISRGLDKVEAVATAAKRAEQLKAPCDPSAEYFFTKMERCCAMLKDYLDSASETADIELPAAAGAPAHLDRRLWRAVQEADCYPSAEAMRLVKGLVLGDVAELVVRVDEVFVKGGGKRIGRSIIGVLQTKIPENATTWFCDATADPAEIEILAGRPIVNRTPPGELQRQQPILQIPVDVKRSTARKRFVEILRAVLLSVPQFNRVGLIADRSHLPAVDGTAKDGVLLDAELRPRITKTAYFRDGTSRGSNGWYQECDLLIVCGTPRVPPSAVKTRLIQLGLVQGRQAAGRLDFLGAGLLAWAD